MDGLRDTTLRRELKTKLLLSETLTFTEVKQEAVTLAEVYKEEEIPAAQSSLLFQNRLNCQHSLYQI